MRWEIVNEVHSAELAISISYPTSASGIIVLFKTLPRYLTNLLDFILWEETGYYNVQIIFKCVNCLNLHCFALTNSDALIVKIKFSCFYLEIFSCHNLWHSFCSLVLHFLMVEWLPFHSTPVWSDFCRPPLFLEGKFFSSLLFLADTYTYHILEYGILAHIP